MNLSQIKKSVQPGDVFDVTNHYITREDHPSFGTSRREVTRVTANRVYLASADGTTSVDGTPWESEINWPKASQVHSADGDTIEITGGGVSQRKTPDAPFLTLRRVAS